MGFLTDTHCHLNLNIFQEDLEPVLERARERGVDRIVVPGIDLETSRSAAALAGRYPEIFAAVGVHPGSAGAWDQGTLAALRTLASDPKVVAVGEIGLDYYRDRAPRPLQRETFLAQLELAKELGLPVIIHNRDAMEDLWGILSAWQAQLVEAGSPLAERPGVMHSYDGDLPTALRAIEKSFFIGISGPVTFKNAAERQRVTAALPLEHLLVETDAPYLTPHPFRGRRNEPAYVSLVAEKTAELHGQAVETVAAVTSQNAGRLFDWRANP